MKKLIVAVSSLALPLLANAQIALLGGGTYSKWQDEGTSYRGGFYAGAVYTFQNDSSNLYADAGALILNRGVNLDGGKDFKFGAEYNFRTSLYSLHVPVDFGCKFYSSSRRYMLLPHIGLYADMGVWGKVSQDGEISQKGGYSHYVKGSYVGADPYRELQRKDKDGIKNFSRFDWGARAGLDAYLSTSLFLSFNYEYGFNKVFESIYFKSKFSSFSLGLGYLLPKRSQKGTSNQPVEL